ncbi:cysteine--tRNA ligase [Candidatus Saccharibacteria bacterium]|nr:cysteine--tRNA ligase [Candidatus Saccharibacteria bacterium]
MGKIKLYNQLSKSIEEFVPQDPQNVKIYTCGPTVYSYAHIGNLTSYIYWDLLIRTLTLNNYQVNRVLNLTDVGHLASDADDGEDKLEKGAKKEGKTVWEIAEKYSEAFLNDFRNLHLAEPQKIAKATDYIKEDIVIVDQLTAKGYTYETSDGVYYDTSKFTSYSDFARLDLDQMRAGARVKFNDEKKNISDFAVWKFVKPGEDHAMQWEYLGRPGYPGWHLECSTIIQAELGIPIDIHTGGIDHIPVHHTNEIAQSEAAFDKKLSNYWLHCDFITIDGEKISKSLGNIYTLSDLAEKDFSPLDFKMWVLQGHYRGTRNFSFSDLAAAKTRRLNWRNRIARLYQDDLTNSDFSHDKALEFVNNNLNSSELLAYIDNSALTMDDWEFVDALLGLDLINSTPNITDDLMEKISLREKARQEKDYMTADKMRDELASANITILDTEKGAIWQYTK